MSEQRNVISTIVSEGGRNRILIVQRPDETFRLVHECFYRSEHEGELIAERWTPMLAIDSIYADAEAARVGAEEWLRGYDETRPFSN